MEVSHKRTSLDSVRYLFLREISEPRDHSERLVVDEAVETTSGASGDLDLRTPNLKKIATKLPAIETTESCRSFELIWESYIAYLAAEECAGSCGSYDDEIFQGKLCRICSKSNFLDHLARDTGAHTQPIQHCKLTCLNHLIDVPSYAPPVIRILPAATTT
jgi:hypothetical protein